MSHQEKLEYLYLTPPEIQAWPIYGSLIRSLGKGWKVGVVSSDPEATKTVSHLQSILLAPNQLVISSQPDSLLFHDCNLVLNIGYIPGSRSDLHHSMYSTPVSPIDSDLVSQFQVETLNANGLTAITGTGKGKTTSALGKILPLVTNGHKVAVVQWFKEFKDGSYTWAINEHFFPKHLTNPELLEFYPTGLGFFGSPNLDRVKGENAYEKHRQNAYNGLNIATRLIQSGEYSEVVLDELIDTVKEIAQNIEYPLIDLKDLQIFLEFCNKQKQTNITVTGRRVTSDWSQFISQSVVINEVKHPWSTSGQVAISGLDY